MGTKSNIILSVLLTLAIVVGGAGCTLSELEESTGERDPLYLPAA